MQHVKTVIKLFLFTLLIYWLLRVLFAFIYFNPLHISAADNLRIFYWGLRLDIAALTYINIPFLLYYFFLAPFQFSWWQNRIALFLFSVLNLLFIAVNMIDLVYYRYNLRRSTVDLFYVFGSSVHSFGSLFRQYWYVLLAFIIVCIFFVYIVKRILSVRKEAGKEKWYWKWGMPVVFMALLVLIARGGDKRPVIPATALLHADAALQPVVNNSTLNLLYSWLRATSHLERKTYFTPAALDSIYTIRRQYDHEKPFEKRNIVIFVMESFSGDFIKDGPLRAKTPFFDSLMTKSIVCKNAFANGHESVMGLLAILGSLPPFTHEPLFISNYSAVPFKGIGAVLKDEGYSTNFFMGAEYDHFNFAKLCRMTGIDHYYSKDTYAHAADDDGNWGIYDGFFFPYFARTMSEKQQPFLSVLFNLSSHPPFTIQPSLRERFTIPGQDAQLNSISYVDYCYSQLFEEIKTKPWFNNTLFVFCADHTLLPYTDQRSDLYNAYDIPLFIYDPKDTAGISITKPVQQLDIIPSVLDKINYSQPFMSFGHSIFRDEPAFSICKKNDVYQLIDSSSLTGFDDRSDKVLYYYDYRSDTLLTKNMNQPGNPAMMQRENFIKAFLQRFNNSMLDQQLLIKK